MTSESRVYFGGSFYPPHKAHDEMLLALLKKSEVKSVHLVPTYQNPLKASSQIRVQGKEVSKNALIYQIMEAWMTSLKTRNIPGVEKIQVEWIEVEQARATYTYDTLSKLSERYPGDPWILCVGDDCLESLTKWKEVNLLLARLKEFWVFPRGRVSSSLMAQIDPSLRALCCWRFMTEEVLDVSSTEIRSLMETADASRELLSKLLPEVASCLQ